jgi:hypothetical protein
LIYIFQFLSPYDLHHSIYNLNSRLNAVYHTQTFYLDFTLTKRKFDCYCANQQSFISQTKRIKLGDEYNRLTLFNTYINIDRFTNLRILKIREATSGDFGKKVYLTHR